MFDLIPKYLVTYTSWALLYASCRYLGSRVLVSDHISGVTTPVCSGPSSIIMSCRLSQERRVVELCVKLESMVVCEGWTLF